MPVFSTTSSTLNWLISVIAKFVLAVMLGVIGSIFLSSSYSARNNESPQVMIEDAAVRSGHADSVRSNLTVEWGHSFGGLQSSEISVNCSFNDFPVCCSVLSYPKQHRVPLNPHHIKHKSINVRSRCELHREYISSPYEGRQIVKATQLHQIPDIDERKKDLISFISSTKEKDAADAWIRRVAVHMSSDEIIDDAKDDEEYLSYFNVTKKCFQTDGRIETKIW